MKPKNLKNPKIVRLALHPEGKRWALYWLNRYGYVARWGDFDSYGAALNWIRSFDAPTELMTLERLQTLALGVQLTFDEILREAATDE